MIALPHLLTGFLATAGLAFIIGLELHAYRRRGEGALLPEAQGFGTTRTVTLISALGFVLWVIAPVVPFCVGFGVLGLALMLEYRKRVKAGDTSLVPTIIGLIAFALGPLLLTVPLAVVAALTVLILVALGEQVKIRRFSDAFPTQEGVTLAKFLVLAGLIYPLLPNKNVPYLPGISWTKIWAAVLVISAISYLGYLAHRYVFPRADTLLTGVLGGLYSSTAATVVLARAAKADPQNAAFAPAAVIIATTMMYARLLVLIALLGHVDAAMALALPFGGLFLASLAAAGVLTWRSRGEQTQAHSPVSANPLDLPVAFLFAALFVFFAAITQLVTTKFGVAGLHVLSFLVGFSDIDPFILSLLAGKFAVSQEAVTAAILIASASNNLLKAGYALAFSRNRMMLPAAGWLCLTAAVSFIVAFA
ncbi:MgtC/SapB family protein [Acidocella aminolytica]|uniref:DUF4010 domain-containing protein n=1 Tax=Acidocella aminolytica 101 = DSM 11237 TaxID=1120923 RepID=A0A0D6PAF0_9PROT|nr:DUF4010 domain-containing protein [Acidocella aminolytica]GAN78725.1 hypothetical protein Aam_007_012 [Acidocella aminolytica 101 = DSM 11237]GBQ38688.1 hypothetical protein AA11237_1868 [Acidocella aminolytica 101 = DSM 11237]SHE78575.1 Uncharacterized membrane protein, DUF4010 family [Acidocella aminolytica 101 = DSM 11237]